MFSQSYVSSIRRYIFTAFFLLFGSSSLSWGQETTGRIEGWIFDNLNKPLPATTVKVRSVSLQGEQAAASNADGYFFLSNLPVGVYTLRLSHVGYGEQVHQNVTVRLGKTTSLGRLQLEPATLAHSEVIVAGEKPLLDPASTTLGANLSAETYRLLPVERNFREIATLIPQANESFYGDAVNISGSTGMENAYIVDGMNVTRPVSAGLSTDLPYNFIKEIEIKTGGYEAEFGRAQGGIINVVTHSGGNELHGQLFGFYTGKSLGGERRPGLTGATVADFARYDVGLTLHGPLVRDRLWFFAAYNPILLARIFVLPAWAFIPTNRHHTFFRPN